MPEKPPTAYNLSLRAANDTPARFSLIGGPGSHVPPTERNSTERNEFCPSEPPATANLDPQTATPQPRRATDKLGPEKYS